MEFEHNSSVRMEHHNGTGILGFILSCVGAIIGANTLQHLPHPSLSFIEFFTDPAFLQFIIRSIIGGTIGFLIKVTGDLIVSWLKNRNQKQG